MAASWIQSKYAGRCVDCEGIYTVGATVLWEKGEGALCQRCGKADEARCRQRDAVKAAKEKETT